VKAKQRQKERRRTIMKNKSKLNPVFRILASAVLSFSTFAYSSAALAQEPYQAHINWAANDDGHENCTERYILPLGANPLAWCLVNGKRACVTSIAIEAAYENRDQLALILMSEITQCHNPDARATLYAAGPQAVGNYLRTTYQRPAWAPLAEIVLQLAVFFGS
jgi:hypothetical protein